MIREARAAEYEAQPGKPFDFYTHARNEWRALSKVKAKDVEVRVEPEQPGEPVSEETRTIESRIYRTLKRTRNLILYGPPGTGKTYLANKIAEELIREQLQARLTPAASAQGITRSRSMSIKTTNRRSWSYSISSVSGSERLNPQIREACYSKMFNATDDYNFPLWLMATAEDGVNEI